jgi:hypothetical protein
VLLYLMTIFDVVEIRVVDGVYCCDDRRQGATSRTDSRPGGGRNDCHVDYCCHVRLADYQETVRECTHDNAGCNFNVGVAVRLHIKHFSVVLH